MVRGDAGMVGMPDGDGIALLRMLHKINPSTFILIITAYATVENAVEAFKAGAFDYLVKPVIFEDLGNKLNRVFQYRDLYLENQQLRRELAQPRQLEQIVEVGHAQGAGAFEEGMEDMGGRPGVGQGAVVRGDR